MPTLYIVAGCNGAGKTTASYTILPDVLNCREFVNADNIAAGLSPFDVEKYAVEAGRLMLNRITQLMEGKADFAIETTLASKTYQQTILNAKSKGYEVILFFFWLSSSKLAIQRVKGRVRSGGHNIPIETIKRRYTRGLKNFMDIYIPLVDIWTIFDNSEEAMQQIASGARSKDVKVFNEKTWSRIKNQYRRGKA